MAMEVLTASALKRLRSPSFEADRARQCRIEAAERRLGPGGAPAPAPEGQASASEEAEFCVAAADGYALSVVGPRVPRTAGAVLLLHGRTWSSGGVWGQPKTLRSLGRDAYALDFRHFGRTPDRSDGFDLKPSTCCGDARAALAWLRGLGYEKVALLGWSFGALVAQLVAVQEGPGLDALVLYASVWDRAGAYCDPNGPFACDSPRGPQTFADCLSDFTLDNVDAGSAKAFAAALLEADPVRVDWSSLSEFEVDLAKIVSPTLCVYGDADPHAPDDEQTALLGALGAMHKRAYVVPDSDHVAHVTANKRLWTVAIRGFLSRT